MKKILFTLVMALCCLTSTNAQKYVPLVSEDYLWSYCDVIGNRIFGCELLYSQFYFKGDTVINQNIYKKLYRNACDQNKIYYIAAMREVDKKTYAVFIGENKEKLIYDFGLNKGDDFHSELTNITYKVQDVDSVTVNGGKRKRINFEYSFDIWVEGIGSLDNHYLPYPLNGILTYDIGKRFNYQKNKGDLVYNTSEWYFNEYDCGQYKKYFDNNPVWTYENYSIFDPKRSRDQLFFKGDTLINNISYKKLYNTIYNNSFYTYQPACIREENGKVYGVYFGNFENKEFLMYDYTLNVGDTLKLDCLYGQKPYPDAPVIINKIDTLELLSGEKRKVFNTSQGFSYVEGIGNLRGLFSPFLPIATCGCFSELTCYKENDNQLYINPKYCEYNSNDCCDITKTDVSQLKQINLTISPNPAKDLLKITLNKSVYAPTTAKIINSLGKTVLVQKLENQEQTVSLKNIPAGIYLLQIEKGNQKESVKFIKQ